VQKASDYDFMTPGSSRGKGSAIPQSEKALKLQAQVADDTMDKAFLELQDAKVNFF